MTDSDPCANRMRDAELAAALAYGDGDPQGVLALIKVGADIRYNDPYAAEISVDGGQRYRSVPLDRPSLEAADLVVIVTNHSAYDYDFIVKHGRSILDTRNATRGVRSGGEKIRRI